MPIEEVATKRQRECWTALFYKTAVTSVTVPGTDITTETECRTVQVLAPSFKAAALKAAKWQTNNSEWVIQSLCINTDSVI